MLKKILVAGIAALFSLNVAFAATDYKVLGEQMKNCC